MLKKFSGRAGSRGVKSWPLHRVQKRRCRGASCERLRSSDRFAGNFATVCCKQRNMALQGHKVKVLQCWHLGVYTSGLQSV